MNYTEITYPGTPGEQIFFPADPSAEYGHNATGKRIPREHLEGLYDEGKIALKEPEPESIENDTDGSWFILGLCSLEEMERRIHNTKNQLRIVTEAVKRQRKYGAPHRMERIQKKRLMSRLDTQLKTLQQLQREAPEPKLFSERLIEKLTWQVKEAAVLIEAAVEIMTLEQLGQWGGVRAWQETVEEGDNDTEI